MISKDLFLAKDPHRIGALILRDHGDLNLDTQRASSETGPVNPARPPYPC